MVNAYYAKQIIFIYYFTQLLVIIIMTVNVNLTILYLPIWILTFYYKYSAVSLWEIVHQFDIVIYHLNYFKIIIIYFYELWNMNVVNVSSCTYDLWW